jgi:hypothetical protein
MTCLHALNYGELYAQQLFAVNIFFFIVICCHALLLEWCDLCTCWGNIIFCQKFSQPIKFKYFIWKYKNKICYQCSITKLLDAFSMFMDNRNEKYSNDRGRKICWVAGSLVSRSERGNKQNFNLGLIKIVVNVLIVTHFRSVYFFNSSCIYLYLFLAWYTREPVKGSVRLGRWGVCELCRSWCQHRKWGIVEVCVSALDSVVEECVSFVGVDVNTGSEALLR